MVFSEQCQCTGTSCTLPNIYTVRLLHRNIVTQWHSDTVTQWHSDTVTQWHSDTVTQWHRHFLETAVLSTYLFISLKIFPHKLFLISSQLSSDLWQWPLLLLYTIGNVQYCTILYSILLYCSELYCTVLYSILLYCNGTLHLLLCTAWY